MSTFMKDTIKHELEFGKISYLLLVKLPDMSADPENGSRDLIPKIWITDPFGSWIQPSQFAVRFTLVIDPPSY